jgi:hypothetical protein
VIIFDEYQKKKTVNLKIRVTLNVLLDRNPRKKLRKDPVVIAPTPNYNKVNLKKDGAANEELKIFFYMKIFKR